MSPPTIDPPASGAKLPASPNGTAGGGPRAATVRGSAPRAPRLSSGRIPRVASGLSMRTPSVVTEYRDGSWMNTVEPSGPIDEQFPTADEAWTAGDLIAVLIQAEHVLIPQGPRAHLAIGIAPGLGAAPGNDG